MTQHKTTLLSCLSPSVFVSCEEGYDLKWSVISCSSIWLLNCRHMCCQLLPFLSLLPLLLSSHFLAPSLHVSEGSRRVRSQKSATPVPPPFHTPWHVCFRFCLTNSHTPCHLFLSKILHILALPWTFTNSSLYFCIYYFFKRQFCL